MIPSGSRFGPYEIGAQLGAGGMGEVYRARDTRLGRDVALKVLAAHVTTDPDRLRRFEQEARATSVLNHPHIIAVYDVGSEQGRPYVVYELLEGESLRERLQRGPMPESEAVRCAVQVTRGLAAAHAKGIVHRDLKPENVFLTSDGSVKLLDFGLAKLQETAFAGSGSDAGTTTMRTESNVILGTVGYMAPEQVRAQQADHRADIFAFGIVLYEMLTGSQPFSRPSAVETLNAILKDDPPALTDRAPQLSPSLARIVLHCLEKAPDSRFQSARDLGFALESLSTSHLAPIIEPTRHQDRRGLKFLLPLTALASAVAAFALGWWTRAAESQSMAPAFSNVVRLAATDAFESGAAISPDGKWVAYYSDEGGRPNVWVKFVAGGEPANLTGSLKNVFMTVRRDMGALDISPDGTLIAFDAGPPGAPAGRQSTHVIPAPLGGVPQRLLGAGQVASRWSPDGRSLVFVEAGGSAGDALYVADGNGENPRAILQRQGGLHAHWPTWSADGRFIYFNYGVNTNNAEPTGIYRVPAAGGTPEKVIGTSRRAAFPNLLPDGAMVYAANPTSFELALWWQPPAGGPQRLTLGTGEYAEPRLSSDGMRMIASLRNQRSSLVAIAIAPGQAADPVTLTAPYNGDDHPDISRTADQMVFSSTRGSSRSIWIARPDGSDARPLTSSESLDERPTFSPDGSKVAFVSSRGDVRSIWVVGTEGGAPRRVASAQVQDTLTWSPDGRQIVFGAPAGSEPGLWTVPAEGGEPTRLRTPGPATAPHWSPVRNLIAYLEPGRDAAGTYTKLRYMTPEGQPALTDLPQSPTRLGNGVVAWSPDGRFIAALSDPGSAASTIWLGDLEGRAGYREVLRLPGAQRTRGVTWSRDAKSLIFARYDVTSDIVLFDRRENDR